MENNMLNTMSTKANELIAYVGAAAQKGADFIGEQTPLYVQEILRLELMSNIFWAVILIGVATAAYFLARWFHGKAEVAIRNGADSYVKVPQILFFTICAACGFSSLSYVHDAVKVGIAPRVVLVEKASEVVKTLNAAQNNK